MNGVEKKIKGRPGKNACNEVRRCNRLLAQYFV
jgi:hypothetical protein